MADIVILIIIAASALLGYKKGLVKAAFNLGYHIIALIVSFICYPFVTDTLSKTKLYTLIYDTMLKKATDGELINIDALPEFLKSTAGDGINAAAQNTAATVTNLLLTIASVVIVFVAVKLILSVVSNVLNIFSKIPVIKSFNNLGGFLFGLISGVIIVYIVLGVLAVFPESEITKFMTQGNIANAMYNGNVILQYIFKRG